MHLLVIEDDPDLAGSLTKGFREHGFAVDVASTGDGGLRMASGDSFDLLIIDRMLPGLDGVDVLRELRRQNCLAPAIFLTARSAVEERIEGLESGADDYLTKPFSFAELLARVRVVLRRGGSAATTTLRIGDLELDAVARRVTREERTIDLSPKLFTLLHYLMQNAGRVVTRAMILEHVWEFSFDGVSNVVDVHINRLRQQVDRGFESPLIHTIRGVGYVLRDDRSNST